MTTAMLSNLNAGTLASLEDDEEVTTTTSSNPPTTLASLDFYVPSQEELIDKLSKKRRSPLADLEKDDPWVEFWKETWDRSLDSFDGKKKVKRDEDKAIYDTLISDIVPTKCNAMVKPTTLNYCWTFDCRNVFIRAEYPEAEDFALSVCSCETPQYQALVVTGQPGIGKSAFLLRLLLRRLALKLPTALHIRPNHALLFHKGGVKEFRGLGNGPSYVSLEPSPEHGAAGRIWALVHSNHWESYTPDSAFTDGPFFVVQAASSHPAQHRWTRKVLVKFFYMKPWSFSEVLQARFLITPRPPTEKQLWYLYALYRPSLRSLFVFAYDPDRYHRYVSNEVNKLSFSGLTKLLQFPEDATDTSHYLLSMGPSPTDRTVPESTIASSYILEMFCKKVFSNRVEAARNLYEALHSTWTTPADAGVTVFEHWVHQFLLKSRVIDLFPIIGRLSPTGKDFIHDDYTATRGNKVGMRVALRDLKEHIIIDEIGTRLEFNTYYRPRNTNFPVIDSWVLIQPNPQEPPIFLAFQIITDVGSHDAKRRGLDKMDELGIPEDAQRYLVVLTPTGARPKITVPMDCLKTKLPGATHDHGVTFPVLHCPVDCDALFPQE